MHKFDALEKYWCKELEALNQKASGGTEMTAADLDKFDKIAHSLKCLVTYEKMKEPEEYFEEAGMSGYRGRSMNGRIVNREHDSYADGYSRGYMEGRSQAEAPLWRY